MNTWWLPRYHCVLSAKRPEYNLEVLPTQGPVALDWSVPARHVEISKEPVEIFVFGRSSRSNTYKEMDIRNLMNLGIIEFSGRKFSSNDVTITIHCPRFEVFVHSRQPDRG